MPDNNVVVTGATSGIGLELTKHLLLENYQVTVVGRDHDKYQETVMQWSEHNARDNLCRWINCDFNDPLVDLQPICDQIPSSIGFVNCAGILPISPLKMQRPEQIISAVNVNLLSPILFTRALLRAGVISRGGSLVFLSSVSGVKTGPKAHAVYAATKAGICGLVMSLANELSSAGIRVNAIAPGTVQSPMLDKTKKLLGDEAFNSYIKQYPLGIGSPAFLLPMVMLLLESRASQWITGQTFVIDGGFSLN
jgi:NAD(P)-dependent dehydrogenase (short-subunit alcohol dehydrogenase family)